MEYAHYLSARFTLIILSHSVWFKIKILFRLDHNQKEINHAINITLTIFLLILTQTEWYVSLLCYSFQFVRNTNLFLSNCKVYELYELSWYFVYTFCVIFYDFFMVFSDFVIIFYDLFYSFLWFIYSFLWFFHSFLLFFYSFQWFFS